MSKHTSGLWRVDISSSDRNGWDSLRQYICIETDEYIIAAYTTASCEYPDDEQNAANARLMAAAPDLLEALRELVAHLEEHDERNREPECPVCMAVVSARAAIAKATGSAS